MTGNENKISCYGKKINCPDRPHCELAEPCLNRAREIPDAIHYHYYQNISLPNPIFDPDDPDEPSPDAPPPEFPQINPDSDGQIAEASSGDLNLDGLTIPADQRALFVDIVRKLAEFQRQTPHVLDALFRSVLDGKTQSDIARDKKVTRACVNKWLLAELKISQKHNDAQIRREHELELAKQNFNSQIQQLREKNSFLQSLSPQNWLIYKLIFIDGCSRQSAAGQLHIGTTTIDHAVHFLRSKLGENGAISRGRKKKRERK